MLRLEDVKEGDVLVADGGFTCLKEGERCEVRKDEVGLYVLCQGGKHYLEGQTDDGVTLIGFTKIELAAA